MGDRRVVVTGYEAITPAGAGAAALQDAVFNCRPCGGPVTHFDVSRNASQIAAAIPDFDPVALGLEAQDAARMDRATQLAVIAARAAFARSGLGADALNPLRAGVCIGTAIGGTGFMEEQFRRICIDAQQKPQWVSVGTDVDPNVYGAFLAFSVSVEVARDLGLHGPTTTMATGCTAGVDAIGTAENLIRAGLADVVITGGVDAPLTPIVLTSFDNIRALTRRNEAPQRASRPFDRDRDGFLLAEGCGILVLEEESHARRRGAPIHGRVLGYASLSNAYHMTSLSPDGEALSRAISESLTRARINAADVDYINAHGSSTPQNDRNETGAFKRTFGGGAYRIPISSTKSILGHSLGAASAIESIVCLMALEEGVVPPTANYETPSPDCDLDYVPNAAREQPLRVAECNASGFSGIHSALLLGHRDLRVS
jgi:3-oxoacyl-(acyl-carrier-protein) synthase